MKKVLIITYYWPPSGGAGVQRWLKFVKYLRSHGWEPVVYTPANPEAPVNDDSLQKDLPAGLSVVKTPIWEPYGYYRRITGMKSDEKINAGFLNERRKPGTAEILSVWIRGNFFIPDARRFWIRPSVQFLDRYLKEHPVQAVISTGPPHSMHMIALGLKKKTGIPWLADFRDPWTGIDFYDQLRLSKLADRAHKRMEREVLATADRVVTVSNHWAEDMKHLCSRHIDVVTNGFDPDDFPVNSPEPDAKFSITHIGSLNKDRNPLFLWETLNSLCRENPEFAGELEIKFIGKTDVAVFDDLEKNGLIPYLVNVPYLPHDEVLIRTMCSRVLLLPVNQTPNMLGIIPGKVFEYLAARRPILCIAPPEGDSAAIIREARAGSVVAFDDSESLKTVLKEFHGHYRNGLTGIQTGNIDHFSRKKLAGNIAALLNEMISGA